MKFTPKESSFCSRLLNTLESQTVDLSLINLAPNLAKLLIRRGGRKFGRKIELRIYRSRMGN